MNTDSRIQGLLDREAIRDVIHLYCRGIDRLDRDLVRRCYHSDGYEEHGSFEGGIDAYLDWVWEMLAKYERTQHLVCNILIEIKDDRAVAESCALATHFGLDGKPQNNLITGFRYLDRFERRSGEWKILRRIALPDWSRIGHSEDRWLIPDRLTQGRRDQSDISYSVLSELRGDELKAPPHPSTRINTSELS